MLEKMFSLISLDLGLDMGSANSRVYVKDKGIALREPSAIARHKKSKRVLSIGTEAKKMLGKTPVAIEAIRPIVNGVISDYDGAVSMLTQMFKMVHGGGSMFGKIIYPKVVVAVPLGITNVERRAVHDAVISAGARSAILVDQAMAAAVGADASVTEAGGILVVNIGAGRTEMAVISLGGVVTFRSLKSAGVSMDQAIVNFLRNKYALMIGDQTAEEIKLSMVGSIKSIQSKKADPLEAIARHQLVIRGRDLNSGLPVSMKVAQEDIWEAVSVVISEIVTTLCELVEETPAELISDIVTRGMLICGGGAMLPGLGNMISKETRIPIWYPEDPMSVVVKGCGKLCEDANLSRLVSDNFVRHKESHSR